MPKKLVQDLNDRITTAIGEHPDGITAVQLSRRFSRELSPRTLGRRLKFLVQHRRIAVQGAGRASRYVPLQTAEGVANVPLEAETVQASGEVYVPLSPEGTRARNLVRRSLSERSPIGYDRAFLDAYRPNETWYLARPLRERLHELGRTRFAARPAGTYARDIMSRLLIDLSWASSRLEGNTYTRLDTQQLIEFGRVAEGKDARETQMILNHKQAIEFLIDGAEDIKFNAFTFFNLHALLSENLLADPGASGRVRERIVDISGTTYHPLAIPQQIEELFRLILEVAEAIRDPFEQAFFLLVHIPYLQPFEDVNKRVSRLGANIPFFKANLCPLSFVDVPERAYVEATLGVYELRSIELLRDVFAWAYERSCLRYRVVAGALPEPDPLRLRYREALREIVATIIRGKLAADDPTVERLSHALVPEAERAQFAKIALEELNRLHEGNIARYRIKLSEFNAWKSR